MSNIEDDIKILKDKDCLWIYSEDDILKAQEHILSERDQDKARIKELEEENASKQKAYDDCYCEYKYYKQFDSIPKQKVKDKIEELENARRETTRENWHYIYSIQLKILKELLEEGE